MFFFLDSQFPVKSKVIYIHRGNGKIILAIFLAVEARGRKPFLRV
jgi:hypothetical protein